MQKLNFEFDEKLIESAEEVLDEMGLDILSAIKVMLKRIVREKSASFMFENLAENKSIGKTEPAKASEKNAPSSNEPIKMTKNKAVGLFRNKGISFVGNITFASKNKSAYNYWANPSFDVLNDNWFLILNDWVRQEIHLFEIPAHTFEIENLVPRSDKPEQIDLQIMYEDASFTDNRSKISFARFLIDKISY